MAKPLNLNILFIAGTLLDHPQEVIEEGRRVVKFSVAIQRSINTEDGKTHAITVIPCECHGRRGQALAKTLAKGDPIYCHARLEIVTVAGSSLPFKAVVNTWQSGGFVRGEPSVGLLVAAASAEG